jgi:hypothetical protein
MERCSEFPPVQPRALSEKRQIALRNVSAKQGESPSFARHFRILALAASVAELDAERIFLRRLECVLKYF